MPHDVYFLEPTAICGWFELYNVNLRILSLHACENILYCNIWLYLLSGYCRFMYLRCFKINAPGIFVRECVKVALAGAYPSLHWIESKKTPMTHHQDTELTLSVTHVPMGSSESLTCLTHVCGMWEETHTDTQHIKKDQELNLFYCATALPPFTTFIHKMGDKNKTA